MHNTCLQNQMLSKSLQFNIDDANDEIQFVAPVFFHNDFMT